MSFSRAQVFLLIWFSCLTQVRCAHHPRQGLLHLCSAHGAQKINVQASTWRWHFVIGLVCRQALQAPEDNETWGAERVRGGLERKAARRLFSVRATMLLLRENRTSVSAFPPAGKRQPQQLHRATASPEVQKRNSLSSSSLRFLPRAVVALRLAVFSSYDILRSKLGCSDRASAAQIFGPGL